MASEQGRVGFLGLGTMGAAMAANLARAGFDVTAWNRTPGRAAELDDARPSDGRDTGRRGAATATSSWSASRTRRTSRPSCSVPTASPTASAPGSLVIDCSTISPAATREFAERLAEREASARRRAGVGRLRGRAEGHADDLRRRRPPDVERARPVLAAMGKTITHVGPLGAGQAVKAVNQVILAGAYLGVAEGIVLAMKAGLDVEQVVAALSGGVAQSWVLANRSGRMIANDYPLGFKVALHRKDLGIALELARELGAEPAGRGAGRATLEAGLIAQRLRRRGHVGARPSIRARSGLDG